MRLGRPTPPLTLTDDERETLGQWARRPKTAQALAQRARMVLECSKGKTNTAVAAELRVSQATVGKWRSRFLESRKRRLASGGLGSWRVDWTDWWMKQGLADPALSPMLTLRGS